MPFKKRSSKTRKGLSKAQAKAVKKIVRSKLDQDNEDKRVVYIKENGQLDHNKPFYIGNFLSDIQQGFNTGDDAATKTCRIGDRIRLKNVNMRFWLSNKLDRPNVIYKAVLFWYQQEIGAGLVDSDVWLTQTNKMLDRYNTKSINIIDTFIVKSTANYAQPTYYPAGGIVAVTGKEKSYLATLNKSYKNKYIQFQTNSKLTKLVELGIALVAYDAYGTLQSDNIASFAINSQLTFEDA